MLVRKGLVALVAAAGLALTACTGGAPAAPAGDNQAGSGDITGTITFQSWSLKNETFTPYFQRVIKDFEAEHPGTTVNWVDQPADGYEDKILQQAESGELPDVLNLPPDFAYQLAKADQLADLKAADADALDAYVPGGVEAYQFEDFDGTYGYPWYLGTSVNFWNVSLFKKAGLSESDIPADNDQLFDVAEKMAKSKVRTISSLPTPKSLYSEFDLPFYENGKFVFNTAEAAAVVDRYADLYQQGAVAPSALQGEEGGNSNTFNQGTVSWTTATPYYPTKDLQINAPKLVPNVSASASFGNPPLFVQGVSVAKNSEQSATAVAFAQYLTSNKEQVEFVKLAPGFLPGTNEANQDPSSYTEESDLPLQNDATKIGAEQMKTAQLDGTVKYSNDMNTYAKQQIALAVKGEISSQEALDKAAKYCNDNLQQ